MLGGLAFGDAQQDQPERATQHFSAADRLRETIGVCLLPIERVNRGWHFDVARRALGEEAFRRFWGIG